MRNRTRHGSSAVHHPTAPYAFPPQQPPAKRTLLTKSLPPLHGSTSTDSLSDNSPVNGSTTGAATWAFHDLHDSLHSHSSSGGSGSGTRIVPGPVAPTRRVSGTTTTSNLNTNTTTAAIVNSRMQGRVPSRHGSLDNLGIYDMPDSASGSANTAPPARLPKRASPSTTGLSASVNLTPTNRHLPTPPQTALAMARLRQVEVEGTVGRSRSPSQDLSPFVNAHPRTSLSTHAGAILADDVRRGSVASQGTATSNNDSQSAPDNSGATRTLVVNTNVGSSGGSVLTLMGSGIGSTGSTPARPPLSNASVSATRAVTFDGAMSAREEAPVVRRHASLSPSATTAAATSATLAFREEGRENVVNVPAAMPSSAEASTRCSPFSSPTLHATRRRRSESNREASTSPSVDSTAAQDEADVVTAGQPRSRNTSLGVVNDGSVKSPSTGPKRVHFSFRSPAPQAESGFLASAARAAGEEVRTAPSTTSRVGAPVALNTSPLLMELANSSMESSGRAGQSASAKLSASPNLSSAPASASSMSASQSGTSTLSLRLNVKDGRIEATAAPSNNSSLLSASRSILVNSSLLSSDRAAGATYTPQMPLPKPALKSYSRYSGDTSSPETSPAGEHKSAAAARRGSTVAQSVMGSLHNVVARYQHRRGSTTSARPAEALTLPASVSQQRRAATSELMVKWSLLGFAALLSIVLIVVATTID